MLIAKRSPAGIWPILLILLAAMLMASLLIGARPISPATVLESFGDHALGADHLIVRESRLPRTLLGLLAGMALGAASVLIQAFTRNPLADPGILGIQSGASAAVVVAVAIFGIRTPAIQAIFALAGALLTTLFVYMAASRGGGRIDPLRFILAGLAIGAMLHGMSSGLTLLNPAAFDRLRFWSAGTLDIRDLERTLQIAPLIAAGCLLALALAQPLNTLQLGDDLAAALGARTMLIRTLTLLAITLLCGTATATVGPIGFVGLLIPQLARRLLGSDLRRVLPFALLATPSLLLAADICGRLLVPGELRVSIVTAFLGAPVLIWLARKQQ